MIEGTVIIFKNNDDIKNSYYFKKTNDEKNPYNFEYKKIEKDDAIIEKKKKIESLNYEKKLPEIFNYMKQFIKDSSSFENIQKIKFKDDSIDKFIEYLNFGSVE